MPRFPSAAAPSSDLIQTGTIVPYGGAAAPDGYLLCNGAAISRTTYSDLFAVIGTAYGVGDGSTTFNVPDMQGNVPVGKGASGVTNIGDTGGEQTHTLGEGEIPSHLHTIFGNIDAASGTARRSIGGSGTTKDTSSVGGDGAHQNMQPYVGTEYIIKT